MAYCEFCLMSLAFLILMLKAQRYGILLCLLILLAPIDALASIFIPAPSRLDMVHDDNTDILYITNGSSILRYNTTSMSFLSPITIDGANLRGIDLSPDGNTLVVGDGSTIGSENRVRIVDTTSLANRDILFPRQSLESGTYVPAFISEDEFLVSSTFAGSGWVPLRKVQLGTDAITTLRTVRQSTMLTPSADLSMIAYAESNISSGSYGGYSVEDGTFSGSSTGSFAFEIGVSRNGSQFAVPSYRGTRIYDRDFNLIDRIGIYANESPIGVAYSPVANLVYFAWYDRDNAHPSIDVYDTDTLTLQDTLDFQPRFGWNGNSAFNEGRLEISRDGSLLFATVDGGVQMYYTGIPEPSSLLLVAGSLGTLGLFIRKPLRNCIG